MNIKFQNSFMMTQCCMTHNPSDCAIIGIIEFNINTDLLPLNYDNHILTIENICCWSPKF